MEKPTKVQVLVKVPKPIRDWMDERSKAKYQSLTDTVIQLVLAEQEREAKGP
jgi:hypothetical protein